MGPFSTVNYGAGTYARGIDLGAVMRQVYLWLAVGLSIGFGVAFALGRALLNAEATGVATGVAGLVLNPAAIIVSLLVYIVIGFAFYPVVRRAPIGVGAVLYMLFAAIFGFFISTIFLYYSVQEIALAFATTAGMFLVMSVIGFVTRADLSKLGMILFMALIGLIIASVVNIFLASGTLYWIITYAGVVIFCGLIAYDTQWIKRSAAQVAGSTQSEERLALIGAFKLFLDFINLFMFLLRIFGRDR